MKKAIKQKLLNLVKINSIDYCIKSQISMRHIDIFKYINKEDFLNFINGETSIIPISSASDIGYFESNLKNSNNIDEFIEIVNQNNLIITDARKAELSINFESNKKKHIAFFVDQIRSHKKKFISLNRLAKNYFEDTTVWPLYITHQFLRGKIDTNSAVKAPLILYKVEIVEEGTKLFIRKILDEKFVNEKIQVLMNKEFPTNTTIEELFENISFEKYIERYQGMLGYDVPYDTNNLLPFVNEDAKKIISDASSFEILPYSLIGIFEPGGSALGEDLKKIIDQDVDPFENQIDSSFKSNEYFEDKIIKNNNIFELTQPLNIYQKYAVASSLSQSTVIYGPPGTGKSEVISNIICNALIKGKTSLMVSEKKAALEVLTERMKTLSQFALFLYDTTNKENFYKKISNLDSLLGTQWYREPSRFSKSATIEPIKFSQDELMFSKNYEDWYIELKNLVNKNWKIEDFSDGIFKMDYSEYDFLKKTLGEQICTEWLQNYTSPLTNKEQSLYEDIKSIFDQYNFSKIDDFFISYLATKKFIKKYDLQGEDETLSDVNKNLKFIIDKINSKTKMIEKFLLGGNKLNNLINNFFIFKEENKTVDFDIFNEKNPKEKIFFLNQLNSYINFKKRVFDKDSSFISLSNDEIKKIISKGEIFIDKHKKAISKDNWLDFLQSNSDKISTFLEIYENSENNDKEIFYAEFIINQSLIKNVEDSKLNIKQIRAADSKKDEILEMIYDFNLDIDSLKSTNINELIKYKEMFNYDFNFLLSLHQFKELYEPLNQEIIKEWEWISKPYIKSLYLNPIILFDFDKIQPIIQRITTPINHDQFLKLKIISMWNRIINENPMFLELKGIHLQDIIIQLRKESQRAASLVEEITFKKYINNLRNYLIRLSKDEKNEIANLLRLASSSSHPPIAQFVKKYYTSLKKLFPIWVARPDNVADMIPLIRDEFDYGIFDEASQISLERAYPLVYRTNIKVVSGDDKQLKPSSFFASKLVTTDFDIDDFDREDSLLERAKVSWWNEFHLRNHYRSESKQLIEFSNKFIYKNNLEVATKRGTNDKESIEVYNVNGNWDQINQKEAEKVVDILINQYQNYEKILIITFNSKQSQYIESLLIENSSKLPDSLKEMVDNGQVIITNLENVQGNEGDLVILSISYGPNNLGVIKNNFGPLNTNGGMNRLNVAITRARSKMIIVKSLYGYQIKVANVNNKNAIVFKKFVEYIDGINNEKGIETIEKIEDFSTKEIATSLFDDSEENEIIDNNNLSINDLDDEIEKETEVETQLFSAPIVKEIYGELVKTLSDKYVISNDFPVGSKKIDILIKKRQTNEIVKAILICKWKTNRTEKLTLEDIDRQYFLEDRGYSTFRINEYEWNIDGPKIITKIKNSLSNTNENSLNYIIWQSEK